MKDYITNANMALKNFREIKNMIRENAAVMKNFNCSLGLTGNLHGQRHDSIDEVDLSKAMWLQFVGEIPFCTVSQRHTIESLYATKYTFWESADEIAWLQGTEAVRLRMLEQIGEVKDWLKAGIYFEKKQRFEMNHNTIPQKQKLYCTPNVSGGREAHWWSKSRTHAMLNSLDSVLYWLSGKAQPDMLAGDKILKQVDADMLKHGTLKNKVFLGEFFIIKMTVSGNSILTLRTAAHTLLLKSDIELLTVTFKKQKMLEAASEPEAATVPEQISTEPEAATVPEQISTEPEAATAPEQISTEPQKDLEIIVQFTKKDGLLVYGDTKQHKEIMKAHGLRWFKEKGCWYIYGSRNKEDLGIWEKSRIERMIKTLREVGCRVKIKVTA